MNYLKDLFDQKSKRMNELEIRRIDKILTINGFKDFLKKMQIYFQLIFDSDVLYALAFIAFSLLGLFVHNFFFAFHLIEFIKTQPILRNVLKAVYEPLSQLVFIFIFFIILVYFYSLIIFYFFYDIMPENSCSSVVICLAAIYSNTFTSGGNLGNFIDQNEEHMNNKGDMPRCVLDISFTIIMVWLVFQMVSGLIVDSLNMLVRIDPLINDLIITLFAKKPKEGRAIIDKLWSYDQERNVFPKYQDDLPLYDSYLKKYYVNDGTNTIHD